MKKYLSLILVALISISLTACENVGENSNNTPKSSQVDITTEQPETIIETKTEADNNSSYNNFIPDCNQKNCYSKVSIAKDETFFANSTYQFKSYGEKYIVCPTTGDDKYISQYPDKYGYSLKFFYSFNLYNNKGKLLLSGDDFLKDRINEIIDGFYVTVNGIWEDYALINIYYNNSVSDMYLCDLTANMKTLITDIDGGILEDGYIIGQNNKINTSHTMFGVLNTSCDTVLPFDYYNIDYMYNHIFNVLDSNRSRKIINIDDNTTVDSQQNSNVYIFNTDNRNVLINEEVNKCQYNKAWNHNDGEFTIIDTKGEIVHNFGNDTNYTQGLDSDIEIDRRHLAQYGDKVYVLWEDSQSRGFRITNEKGEILRDNLKSASGYINGYCTVLTNENDYYEIINSNDDVVFDGEEYLNRCNLEQAKSIYVSPVDQKGLFYVLVYNENREVIQIEVLDINLRSAYKMVFKEKEQGYMEDSCYVQGGNGYFYDNNNKEVFLLVQQ